MTEDQVERAVERMFDALDARLMAGKLSQAEYDAEGMKIARWAYAVRGGRLPGYAA
jgi:hypothetical protein